MELVKGAFDAFKVSCNGGKVELKLLRFTNEEILLKQRRRLSKFCFLVIKNLRPSSYFRHNFKGLPLGLISDRQTSLTEKRFWASPSQIWESTFSRIYAKRCTRDVFPNFCAKELFWVEDLFWSRGIFCEKELFHFRINFYWHLPT